MVNVLDYLATFLFLTQSSFFSFHGSLSSVPYMDVREYCPHGLRSLFTRLSVVSVLKDDERSPGGIGVIELILVSPPLSECCCLYNGVCFTKMIRPLSFSIVFSSATQG